MIVTSRKAYVPKRAPEEYVDETFEDQDPRNTGRRVRIDTALPTGKFRGRVVVNPSNPSTVGRHVSLTAESIDKRYRKVSH